MIEDCNRLVRPDRSANEASIALEVKSPTYQVFDVRQKAKNSAGNAELFAGRGEKGGLMVLLDDTLMIVGPACPVAQLCYIRGVNYFTLLSEPGGELS
jgi:hypothetical protein